MKIICNETLQSCKEVVVQQYHNIIKLPYGLPELNYNYPDFYNFGASFFIFLGIFSLPKFAWMIIYEIKFGKDAGMEYFKYGKEYVKNKYKR